MPNPEAPGQASLAARRGTPFADFFRMVGVDLTGATAHMQVRGYPDAPDPVLIDFTNATYPFAGSPVAVIGVEIDLSDALPVSTIRMFAARTKIDATLPFPNNGTEPGDPVRLAYDIVITPAGGPAARWFEGQFYIFPGVTK